MSNDMEKVNRATEIHRSMTSHQMALRIVELEDIADIVGQLASERSNRITELQAALDLAEEAVRAKHFPDAANMVPDGWKVVPIVPTEHMIRNSSGHFELVALAIWSAMLSAAPKLGGE